MGRPLDEDIIIKILERWQKAFKENSHYVSASDLSLVIKDVRELPTIQSVATDTNVGDTISRQATIDAANDWYEGLICGSINGLIKRLNALPPAQPEPHWIPCSERMPEEHEWLGTKKFGTTISDEVYVTFANEKGERFCQHMKFQNGELSRCDQFYMDTWFKGSKPIAWMPLPEAYKPNK